MFFSKKKCKEKKGKTKNMKIKKIMVINIPCKVINIPIIKKIK
jgi:hypothetical protein